MSNSLKINQPAITIPALMTYMVGALFLYGLFSVSNSGEGLMGWAGMAGFALVFPFYLMASLFIGHFTETSYVVLFLISSTFYLVLLYRAIVFLQLFLSRRYKIKPLRYTLPFGEHPKKIEASLKATKFTLKRIRPI